METQLILTRTLSAAGGLIGCITLNKPKALNALDLEMVEAMHQQLLDWQQNENIKAVFIDSTGEKAFCAGGDIVSMYQSMKTQRQRAPGVLPEFMAQFFAQEYRLDYQIHAFSKPIICWGNGIIMGGGLGVFAGASTKIVTERSRVAMPEITIGLFPDVGASYFLNKMPAGIGKFLGLTGTHINGKDCLDIGLADYYLSNDDKDMFIEQLLALTSVDQASIDLLCNRLELNVCNPKPTDINAPFASGVLTEIMALLSPLDDITSANRALIFISKLASAHPNNKVLKRAYSNLINGSPITAHLVMQQLQRSRNMTLANCFRMELSMAYQCSVVGEFEEGVRALLIDKDNLPKWKFENVDAVPTDIIDAHFSRFSGKPAEHPLVNLERDYG